MARREILLFFVVCAMASVLDGQTLGGPMHDKAVVCYVASWAAYRPGNGAFTIENLEPSLCTHLVYSFAGLDNEKGTIKSLDAWQDLEVDYGKAGYKRLVGLKKRYPHLKVTIAIGGWNEGSAKYSTMAATRESRQKFIDSVMVFLDQYKFDGLDLDWEYPARRDGRPEDKANYVALVKELSEAFKPRGYILTAALGAGKDTMDAAYDLPKLSRYLDLLHMMCYDYHGTWDGTVGANAPLRGTAEEDVLSVEYTIKYMIEHGVSPYKLVLGLPMYGRTFLLKDAATRTIEFGKTPAQATGFKGPFTGEAGFMGFNEICQEISNTSSKWTHHWHDQSSTPYLRDGERIITYDNARSIAIKVKMANDYGLGGLMVWSIDTDDFKGICEKETDAYVDFVDRYNQIKDDPVMTEALKTLNLADASRISKRTHYSVSNGQLHLRLPESQYTNYPLMETINDAAMLAMEEKRIMDEMDRITKENEIDDDKTKPGAGSRMASSMAVILCCLLAWF
ncbi:probable chitinase 2 [Ostrinia furnacalis]|uniref:probable chitinase 2 n=1 Tax=Ostrinia furnacalis TaxID=93504 RepID=UPI0010386D64|nr:probable chitinase 2 [Ostrinia furnacalis]